jgi:uncharacterized protein (DUF4415 family)
MSSGSKSKTRKGIKHYKGVDIDALPEGDDEELPAKIRITTMVDADIIAELKRLARTQGDGRYQTYLNQFLREHLFGDADQERIEEVVRQMVKASALKK